jgi:hypothetical protein
MMEIFRSQTPVDIYNHDLEFVKFFQSNSRAGSSSSSSRARTLPLLITAATTRGRH